ncbi:Chloroperoxidase [Gorgonomyces haynaldii]|nr:Chloroperoxidase [Gorgonomyces haynaldii]
MVCMLFISAVAALNAWLPPPAGSQRSPCPGFNTLANHGYINRNGKNITQASIGKAFTEVYGLQQDSVDFLLGLLAPGTPGQNQWGNLDLANLAVHNYIEHDASLTHDDLFFNNDVTSINYTKVYGMIRSSSNGQTVSLDDVARFKNQQLQFSQKNNPQFSLPDAPIPIKSLAQFFEIAIPFIVFRGNVSNALRPDQIATFFGLNALPLDYQPPKTPVSGLDFILAQCATAAARVSALGSA